MNETTEFKEYCIKQHDVECNQKYDKTLPYSFHLNLVAIQANKWNHLLSDGDEKLITEMGAWGHDLIEDARVTYNDIKRIIGQEAADVIYACTDEKGKDRRRRHNIQFYRVLRENRLAVYVKLCDLIANITYSLLTNSSMYLKYQSEFPHLRNEIYRMEFDQMFDHIEELLEL